MSRMQIRVDHVTRVEGHGNIVVNANNGELEECYLEIVEPPRYFEAMLRGRAWYEAHLITSRICGICSIGHVTASVQATEQALGMRLSDEAVLLRKLILHGETMQSHVLHVYFLAVPDLLNAKSVFNLVESHGEVIQRALRMKKNANKMCDILAGRTIHPITIVPGGYTSLPTRDDLLAIKKMLADEFLPDAEATFETLKALAPALPSMERETEYISLKAKGEYAFYTGDICSSDTGETAKENYRHMTNEFCVPHSTSKHCKVNRSSYMVGALARFNNNEKSLLPIAADMAEALGLKAPCYNPFMNNVAQFIEVAHALEDSLRIIDELLARDLETKPAVRPDGFDSGGVGVGAVEVPRGILYHEYAYDKKGSILSANCIIPTGQNMASIEDDMRALVPAMLKQDRTQEEITFALEVLVRAYDPCISCSVHMLDVKFVD